MPQGAASRALLAVITLITAIAVAIVPVVDARPKDKGTGKADVEATETVPGSDGAESGGDQPPAGDTSSDYTETATMAEPVVNAQEGLSASSNDRTLLSSDADGDYIPDALDNCPNVQNPDQADGDGDGAGDACPVYADFDGDGVPDKDDNCPNIATSDFADRDGDGVGDPCDKSPDGIEPTPVPVPELDGKGGEGETTPPEPVNGSGEEGKTVERDGRSRERQRSRTETSKPIITTGEDGADQGATEADNQTITEGPDAEPYVPPERDNPRRNEELIAEAAASGELYAPPQPPPTPQKAWDQDAASGSWQPLVRIDAGKTRDAKPAAAGDQAPSGSKQSRKGNQDGQSPASDPTDQEVGDSGLARGWMRARLLLQEDAASQADQGDGDEAGGPAPVPVENGLVIRGTSEKDDKPNADQPQEPADQGDGKAEPRDGGAGNDGKSDASASGNDSGRKNSSRRDGSSRAAAAPAETAPRRTSDGAAAARRGDTSAKAKKPKSGKPDRQPRGDRRKPGVWSDDQDFSGGSALDWRGDVDVAGTEDDGLFLTQRSGSGTGKRRGFEYAIPIAQSGTYLVRLYFAEPYWGAPGGPEGEAGRRVFSVAAEDDTIVEDLDLFDEAGPLTALVKQAEVKVDDGELNLRFTASEGEPIVAAIEVLEPAP